MARLPRISDTEWELMRIVWARQPVTSAELIESLRKEDPSWHPVTAKTLLNRLVRKGALAHSSRGRAYLYRARVSEKECLDAATHAFLHRVFRGSLASMAAHLVAQGRVTPGELRELRTALEGAGDRATRSRRKLGRAPAVGRKAAAQRSHPQDGE